MASAKISERQPAGPQRLRAAAGCGCRWRRGGSAPARTGAPPGVAGAAGPGGHRTVARPRASPAPPPPGSRRPRRPRGRTATSKPAVAEHGACPGGGAQRPARAPGRPRAAPSSAAQADGRERVDHQDAVRGQAVAAPGRAAAPARRAPCPSTTPVSTNPAQRGRRDRPQVLEHVLLAQVGAARRAARSTGRAGGRRRRRRRPRSAQAPTSQPSPQAACSTRPGGGTPGPRPPAGTHQRVGADAPTAPRSPAGGIALGVELRRASSAPARPARCRERLTAVANWLTWWVT